MRVNNSPGIDDIDIKSGAEFTKRAVSKFFEDNVDKLGSYC